MKSERRPRRTSFWLVAAFCALTMAFVLPSRGTNAQGAHKPESAAQDAGFIDDTALYNATITDTRRVNIQVRFAEISKNDLQSSGVHWQFPSAENIAFGYINNGVTADALIETLQRKGALNVLAEPNLSAVTGQTASFLAGGEVPVPVPQAQNAITMQYKSFGVSLLFTPTLIRRNRISLHVRPEVSTVSFSTAMRSGGYETPSFSVRRAETTVEMASSQTFVIGGLFQRQQSKDIDKFPVLGDVPVLGALFQSERFRRNETELAILITPYLEHPVGERNLAAPLEAPAVSPPAYAAPRDVLAVSPPADATPLVVLGSQPADVTALDLRILHGRLLRFDSAVTSVFVADPAIADVRVVAPDIIYVFAKKPGTTNIVAIGQASPDALKGESQPPILKTVLPLRVVADAPLPEPSFRTLCLTRNCNLESGRWVSSAPRWRS